VTELIICPYEEVPFEQIPEAHKRNGVCILCNGKANHIPIDVDKCTDDKLRKIREILLSLTKDY
jgi:hypothetical protein